MSLPVDLGRGKHRTEVGRTKKKEPTLDLNERWEYIKCFFLMKEIGDVQSGSSCAVHKHGGGEETRHEFRTVGKGKV